MIFFVNAWDEYEKNKKNILIWLISFSRYFNPISRIYLSFIYSLHLHYENASDDPVERYWDLQQHYSGLPFRNSNMFSVSNS